jgi:hypothetical protein
MITDTKFRLISHSTESSYVITGCCCCLVFPTLPQTKFQTHSHTVMQVCITNVSLLRCLLRTEHRTHRLRNLLCTLSNASAEAMCKYHGTVSACDSDHPKHVLFSSVNLYFLVWLLFHFYSFSYCDIVIGRESNHIPGKERVLLFVTNKSETVNL